MPSSLFCEYSIFYSVFCAMDFDKNRLGFLPPISQTDDMNLTVSPKTIGDQTGRWPFFFIWFSLSLAHNKNDTVFIVENSFGIVERTFDSVGRKSLGFSVKSIHCQIEYKSCRFLLTEFLAFSRRTMFSKQTESF